MHNEIKGMNVTVVGLGRTAVALVKLLLDAGAIPRVTESREAEEIGDALAEVEALGVPVETGGHTAAAFENAFAVIPSPGVAPSLPAIQEAVVQGAVLMSELEFASQFCSSRVVAVTGTNGKTTTTELLRAMIAACGSTVTLAGNNALPLSAAVMIKPQPEFMVVEVSSYQLELVRTFRPWIGVMLNVRPDHMSRYDSLADYAATKGRIFSGQEVSDHAVFNYDDENCRMYGERAESAHWPVSMEMPIDDGLWLDGEVIRHGSDPVCRVEDIQVPGRHNVENVLAALAAMRAGRFQWDRALEGLRGFGGVEHRIEFVENLEGIRFYNDSKSTNLDSVRVALESFEDPIALIMGGQGKGEDYASIAALVEQKVKGLVLIGEESRAIKKAIGRRVDTCIRAKDMNDAVLRAAGSVNTPGVVLLSPGCASFDMYENFEARGADFKQEVHELARVRRLAIETLERR